MNTIHRLAGSSFRFSSSFIGLITCAAVAITMASTATAANQRATIGFSSALISASELRTLLASSSKSSSEQVVRVLDTRELLQADNKTPNFEAGRIPGALPLPYSLLRGPKENPGRGPDLEKLTSLLQPLGLHLNSPIVLTGSGSDPTEFGAVARTYWTLKSVGLYSAGHFKRGLWRMACKQVSRGNGCAGRNRDKRCTATEAQ
jgi:Rhodanese-related sulfurtransferase